MCLLRTPRNRSCDDNAPVACLCVKLYVHVKYSNTIKFVQAVLRTINNISACITRMSGYMYCTTLTGRQVVETSRLKWEGHQVVL